MSQLDRGSPSISPTRSWPRSLAKCDIGLPAERRPKKLLRHPISTKVQFGCTVTILRDDGCQATSYPIVGEDEADPSRGTISYVSPVARALVGKKIGDVVRAGKSDVELVAIT